MDLKPKRIIRLDDGGEFHLNEETGLYRLHLGIPHLDDPKHLHNEYSYECLMEDARNKGMFGVDDGTLNLEEMRKAWRRRVLKERDYCGHGDDDDI